MAKAYSAVLVVLALAGSSVGNRQRWGKIEKEYVLRKPFSDYTMFWRMGGSAKLEDEGLVMRPSATKESGFLWNVKPVGMPSWEVMIEFTMNGPAPVNTGEGLAFWHVSDPGSQGAVYGHSDRFAGLGIFFDSYDSDGDGVGESYVLAMYNDGKKTIDEDGAGVQLGVCFADYRNLPHVARAKIAFTPDNGGHLTVGLDISNSGKFKSCISVKDVKLQTESEYFGVTVSDYGNDVTLHSFLGINTSERYDPVSSNRPDHATPEAVLPEDSESEAPADPAHNQVGFAEHEHYTHLHEAINRLDEKVFVLEDEFGRQFASAFHSHNNNFQHFISNMLQVDVNDKHGELGNRLDTLSKMVETMRGAVLNLRADADQLSKDVPMLAQNANTGPLSASIAEVRQACVEDSSRGQAVVGALKDSVAAVKQRQQQVLTEVHADLVAVLDETAKTCAGSGLVTLLIHLGAGLAVGGGVVFIINQQRSSRY